MIDLGAHSAGLETLTAKMIFQHPFATVAAESALVDDAGEGQPLSAADYVNALVLNEAGDALILLVPNPDTGHVSWHLINGQIEAGEDPFTAVQRLLQAETGCQTHDWTYLSSYLTDTDHHGHVQHLFCAQKVKHTAHPTAHASAAAKWIPLKELRYGLLDGRINNMSHAITISLAFLTILK